MTPKVHPTALIIGDCYISGDVEIGPGAFVLPYCSIRGDIEPIKIGEGSNVQDNVVLHTAGGKPCIIGRNVSIGHGAIVHGATVGDECIIGMNATVLNGAKIGAGSVVGANALVREGFECPENSLVVGVPAAVKKTDPAFREGARKNAAEYHRLRDEYRAGKFARH